MYFPFLFKGLKKPGCVLSGSRNKKQTNNLFFI